MSDYVYLNGEILEQNEARIPARDVGLLYGIGLFETMRVYSARCPTYAAHIRRMLNSAKELNLPIQEEMLPTISQAVELIQRCGVKDGRLRLTVTGGAPIETGVHHFVLLNVSPESGYPRELYEQGAGVWITPQIQVSTDPLKGHKVTSYWDRLNALNEAQRRGCLDAIWFNERRELAEGSISNLFVAKAGELFTPPTETPVLPGITRQRVLDLCPNLGVTATEKSLFIDDLLDADEVFLTNALMEIMPVVRVEQKVIGTEKPGDITRSIAHGYRQNLDIA